MNKNLLLSSLFLFTICAASEETVNSQEATTISADAQTIITECNTITPEPNITTIECETFVADAEVIAPAIEATITESETIVENTLATATEEVEAITTECEFTPSLFVFDFIIELESLTEDWLNLINSAKSLITRCANAQEENTTDATFHLAQAIYNQAINENNSDAHGSLCASLCETSDIEKNAAIQCSAPNYIAIRYVITRNNDNNEALWLSLKELVQAVQDSLQATQEENQEVATQAQEHPVTMMSNAVRQLLTIAQEDNNNSISNHLYISAVTNNTAE